MALTKVTGQVIKNTTDVTVGVLTVTNTLAVGGTVSIGGTLTYEDVTNVDAVGIITARSNILVGSGITLSPDGNIFATGVTTSTTFSGTFSGSTGAFTGDVSIADKIIHTGDTNTAIRFPDNDEISFETAGTERFRVNDGGRFLIGTNSSRETRYSSSSYQGQLQLESNAEAAITVTRFGGVHASRINLQHARGTIDSIAIAQDDDELGQITFSGWDGDTFTNGAAIRSYVDGTPGDDDMPARLAFETTPDGGHSSVERLLIDSSGRVHIATNSGNEKLNVAGAIRSSGSSADFNGGLEGSIVDYDQANNIARFGHVNGASGSARDVVFLSGGAEKVRIKTTGFVGIGSDVPQDKLTIMSANDNALLVKSTSTTQYHSARIHLQGGGTATDNVTALVHGNNNSGGSESYFAIESKNSSEVYIKTLALYHHASDYWDFNSGSAGNTTMRLNAANQLIIGGAGSDRTFNSHASRLQLSGNTYSQSTFSITSNVNGQSGAYIFLCKQRSGSHGGSTAPVNGDIIGQIRFNSADGTDMESVAGQIEVKANDNHGSDSVPSRMSFYTTTSGSASPVERMRILPDGPVVFGSGINPGTTEQILIETGGTIRRRYSSTSGFGLHFTNDSLMPTRYDGVYYNGTGNLGASNYRWNTIFASNGTINTSDRNVKNTIQNSDLGLDFISKLTPVSYKMNAGTSGRTHYGLISQDVETVLTDIGKTGTDFAGFCKDRNYKLESDAEGNDVKTELEGYNYSLRYEEFISPLIKAVQELSAENTALKARLDAAGL